MAITWTEDPESRVHLGASTIQQCNIAAFASADYLAGGYTVNPLAFGLGRVRFVVAVANQTGTTTLGVVWKYNKATLKLQAFWGSATASTALTEVPDGTDFSASTVLFKAEGF